MVSYKKYLDLEIFNGEISFHEYPWHFHDCFTLIVVEKGFIKYEFNDKLVNIEAGEGLIIEPAMVHRNIISQLTLYKAIFVPQENFNSIEKNRIITQKLNDSSIINSIIDLFNKIELQYTKSEIERHIISMHESIIPPNINCENGSTVRYSNAPNLNYDLSIKDFAEEAHLSVFHFQRKFKKKYGLTIGQLKQQEKTIKAKILLENGKLSTDVASELGFFDQSHFIKYFKRMWAITPKHF
jgi:AraC-like DNA-binding protein